MRDGVKLKTIILIPKGAKDAPLLLTRTPHSAAAQTGHAASAHLGPVLQGYDNVTDLIVEGGYIRVIQDIRGKYGSEGDYVMNRPLRGPLNPTAVDHSTDTWGTIDWLVKHLPESNGRVGILGISYDGFLPLMALVDPHPALKAVVPMNPMVDGWRGDDWFHHGAFRAQNLSYIYEQQATRANALKWWTDTFDDYDLFLRAGSTGPWRRAGAWSSWASGASSPSTPPTTPSGGSRPWTRCWRAGPGRGPWRKLPTWPVAGDGTATRATPFYLEAGLKVATAAPKAGDAPYEEYVSDPAKPVPFRARPIQPVGYDAAHTWSQWLTDDQREASGRTDVLAFVSEPLKEPLRISGEPVANLVASTSGSGADWVVKVIDVYPDEVASPPQMGGYQLMVSADIFRGRYRESTETPKALKPDEPLVYRFALPAANHVFRPGQLRGAAGGASGIPTVGAPGMVG